MVDTRLADSQVGIGDDETIENSAQIMDYTKKRNNENADSNDVDSSYNHDVDGTGDNQKTGPTTSKALTNRIIANKMQINMKKEGQSR